MGPGRGGSVLGKILRNRRGGEKQSSEKDVSAQAAIMWELARGPVKVCAWTLR